MLESRKRTLLLKFRVKGTLRFLSHRETAAMFGRAMVRAHVDMKYSEGFNPRPKLSLPLPRGVGVESDAEMLCVVLQNELAGPEVEQIRDRIADQMPDGCRIVSAQVVEGKSSLTPRSADYVFPIGSLADDAKFNLRVGWLQEACRDGRALVVKRRHGDRKPVVDKDVSGYIERVELEGQKLRVKCNITPTGSIRIDEILQLLRTEASQLVGPVRRVSVEWESNGKVN